METNNQLKKLLIESGRYESIVNLLTEITNDESKVDTKSLTKTEISGNIDKPKVVIESGLLLSLLTTDTNISVPIPSKYFSHLKDFIYFKMINCKLYITEVMMKQKSSIVDIDQLRTLDILMTIVKNFEDISKIEIPEEYKIK